MSRRYSDEPVNLIHRIPSPEQISAVRPSRRSLGQAILETGAACVRGLAELFAQVRRMGRMVRAAVRGDAVSRDASLGRMAARVADGVRTAAAVCSRAYDRLAEWIAHLDISVQPIQPTVAPRVETAPESAPVKSAELSRREDTSELRTLILSQQQDIAHLSAQVQELKAMVLSQQQVLLYLGKELEATHAPSLAAALAPGKQSRVTREKPIVKGKDKTMPRKGVQKPSLNL
jgi:hypothetical protein